MARRFTRRELATLIGAGAVVGKTGMAAPAGSAIPGRGKVGVAPLAPGDQGEAVPPGAAHKALGDALAAVTGAASAKAALSSLFRPTDTVGIKVNCLSGRNMSTRVELVEALAALLAEAGVPPGRIVVFERSSRELRRAGFPIRRDGGPYLCYGTDNDYESEPSTSGAIGSCFARVVTTTCTALVSFGVVRDHDLAGVSAGLKNWYGVIHNPNKYHDNNCDPYVADVVRHPFIKDKLRLTLLDGVIAQCHGGPAYRPDAVFPLGLVAAATDPVAADAWAWRVIDQERARRGMPSLAEAKRPPRFIATAERLGLGLGDPRTVKEVRV